MPITHVDVNRVPDPVVEKLPHCSPGKGGKVLFCCPLHGDEHQSAVAFPPNDRGVVRLHCSCGCDPREISAVLGITASDLGYHGSYAAGRSTFRPRPERRESRSQRREIEFSGSLLPHIARCKARAESSDALERLSRDLGVAVAALRALDVGFNDFCEARDTANGRAVEEPHWTFPESSGRLIPVGINRRFLDGSKRQRPGDERGLSAPNGMQAEAARRGFCLYPEGASDTAALYTMNLPACGRPSNVGGVSDVIEYHRGILARNPDAVAVIVGENDRKESGQWPGRDGAIAVAEQLRAAGLRACVVMPPPGVKDSRSWLNDRTRFPENTPQCRAFGVEYLRALEIIDGDAPSPEFTPSSIPLPENSDNDPYKPKFCPHATCIFQEGCGELWLERRAIITRCRKAGCAACLPCRRLHWFNMASERLAPFITTGIWQVNIADGEPLDTIRKRIKRAGGKCVIVVGDGVLSVFSTKELEGSERVETLQSLTERLDAAILTIPDDANRPILASHDMKPEPDEAPEYNWRTVSSAPASIFPRFIEACRLLGLRSVPGRARGPAVVATATFKLDPLHTRDEHKLITEWLFLGLPPPPILRKPTALEIMNSGCIIPRKRKRAYA